MLNYPQVFNLEPYMGEDVPARWFNFEKVAAVLAEKKLFHLDVPKIQKLLSEMCYIEDEAEVEALLDFYHDLGMIIWYGDTVVLQAQWLIDLFRKLITVRPFDEQVRRMRASWMRPCAGKRYCYRGSCVTPWAVSKIYIKTYYILAYEKCWSEPLMSPRYPHDAYFQMSVICV